MDGSPVTVSHTFKMSTNRHRYTLGFFSGTLWDRLQHLSLLALSLFRVKGVLQGGEEKLTQIKSFKSTCSFIYASSQSNNYFLTCLRILCVQSEGIYELTEEPCLDKVVLLATLTISVKSNMIKAATHLCAHLHCSAWGFNTLHTKAIISIMPLVVLNQCRWCSR